MTSTLGNPALHDRSPRGTPTGPTTVSISFLLNSVTMSDESDPVIKRAEWDYAFSGPDAVSTLQSWSPGSTVCVNAPTAGGQYDLAYLYAEGTFVDPTSWPLYQYYYIYTYWNTWVSY